ncbi:hypothetical protein FB451DRAFT_441987 [Mycena latifolia]|nr:hypothetical protein FB451DRAFT_441987 [Mycena latifolia]
MLPPHPMYYPLLHRDTPQLAVVVMSYLLRRVRASPRIHPELTQLHMSKLDTVSSAVLLSSTAAARRRPRRSHELNAVPPLIYAALAMPSSTARSSLSESAANKAAGHLQDVEVVGQLHGAQVDIEQPNHRNAEHARGPGQRSSSTDWNRTRICPRIAIGSLAGVRRPKEFRGQGEERKRVVV